MKKFHFIAIAGIGQSALAKILLQKRYEVTGSDIVESKYAKELKDLGATIYIGHKKENVPNDAIVVVSTAIKEDNPELIRAKEKGIKIILLIENPNWYEDMMRHNYRTRLKPKQFRGMLFSLCSKYNVTPVGVPREFVGSFIYNTLYYQLRDELKGMNMKI